MACQNRNRSDRYRFGDLARISQVKEELVRNLRLLVAEERRQLESDLARKLQELDEMKRRHREEEERVQREVAILTDKMDSLEIPPTLLGTQRRNGRQNDLMKEASAKAYARELPSMTSAKLSDFFNASPLVRIWS